MRGIPRGTWQYVAKFRGTDVKVNSSSNFFSYIYDLYLLSKNVDILFVKHNSGFNYFTRASLS